MSIGTRENFRARIKKVDRKEKYSDVTITTGRYDKNKEQWYNSTWFARFLGDAHKSVVGMKEKDIVVCSGMFTREPWDKDGETQWPKDAQLLVFQCEPYMKQESTQEKDEDDELDPDDIPF